MYQVFSRLWYIPLSLMLSEPETQLPGRAVNARAEPRFVLELGKLPIAEESRDRT